MSASPIHWWDLAGVTGSHLEDAVAGWTLTNAGGELAAGAGPNGQDVASFPSQYDNMNTATGNVSPNGSQLSYSTWVKFDSYTTASYYGAHWFWWGSTSADANRIARSYQLVDTYYLRGVYHLVGGTGVVSANAIGYGATTIGTVAEWHHIVITSESGGSVKFYRDGVLVHTGTAGADVVTPQRLSLACPFFANSFRYQLYGDMAMVGIWDQTLTADDVLHLYNGGLGRQYAELSL